MTITLKNNIMKHIIYFIIFINIIAFKLSANSLSKELNSGRAGDRMGMYYINLASNYAFQDTSLYDFSLCAIGETHIIKFSEYKDTLLSSYENRSVTLYDMRSDTITSIAFRKPGLNINYARPELTMCFPMEPGKSASGYFFAEGKDGVVGYVRHAGKSMVSAMPETATLITPDKDTINNTLVVTYTRDAATIMSQDFTRSYMRTRNKEILSNDSIDKYLTTDSITHSVQRRCWYAQGYRYPIIDIRQYKVYHYRNATDSTTIALYYGTISQENDIMNDPENEIIRSVLKYPNANNKNPQIGQSTKSLTGNRYKSDADNAKTNVSIQEDLNNQMSDDEIGITETCNLYPLIVEGSTTLSYSTISGNNAEIYILSPSGALMWQKTISNLDSSGSIECSTAELVPGDYLLTCLIGEKRYSFKIVKK